MEHKTEYWRVSYNKQQNICPSLLKKSKVSYFQNLDIKVISDNIKFWKSVLHLSSNQIKPKEKINLAENNEIISGDAEIAKICKNYFDKSVGNLDIDQNLECVQDSFKEDLALASIEK